MEHECKIPETVDEVYEHYRGRRQGLLRALTAEKGIFFESCNPADPNLCLYSFPDGTWEVSEPTDALPSELPEPCIGINFARDGMPTQDWLSLVAAHSDAWLYAVTFFYTRNFTKQQRLDLFEMINNFPSLFEVVTGQVSAKQIGNVRIVANMTNMYFAKQAPVPKEEIEEDSNSNEDSDGNEDKNEDSDGNEDKDEGFGGNEDKDEDEEEEEAYCGACQGSYSSSHSQFWILCDVCNNWFHGRCVKVTAAKAQQIDKYRCPSCIKKSPH